MSFTLPWRRPYPDLSKLPPDEIKRLTIELPRDDGNKIMACAVNSAVFSFICQTALKRTKDFITNNSLTYADSTRLTTFISNGFCERAVGDVDQKTPAPDVAGRTQVLHHGIADPAKVPASVGTETPSGSVGEEGEVRGEGKHPRPAKRDARTKRKSR